MARIDTLRTGWYKRPVSTIPFQIRFAPDDRVYTAAGSVEFYAAAAGAGILVEQPCGGEGTCGRCRIRIPEGAPAPIDTDRQHFTDDELATGWRLACGVVFNGPAVVEVPAVSRSAAGKSFGVDLPSERLDHPLVDLLLVDMAMSDRAPLSTVDRLEQATGLPPRGLRGSPRALVELAASSAAGGFVGVALERGMLISAWPGAVLERYGVALDLGTTSLAAALVRLADGAVVSSASCLNPQVAFGADVIARIKHAGDHGTGAADLTRAVREGLASLVAQVLDVAGCDRGSVVVAACAGNPTMMHSWAGVPLTSLGTAPYGGVWSSALTCTAADVDLPIHPNARVHPFPLVRSHVGGDAVAGAVACDLDRPGGRRLLVDLGTNSEVIVTDGFRVVATSAAAGPAFEGVSIRCGMRAAAGAIDAASIAPGAPLAYSTLGGAAPRGLCGSGLIDLVAALLRLGVIEESGRLRRAEEIESPSAIGVRDSLTQVDGLQAFVVADPEPSSGLGAVVLTARDVREIQLATGSIGAAITLACRHLGFEPGALDEVFLAGAFGNFIRKASALRIGLVPAIDPERIRFVGNAAGIGARLALVDRGVLERAGECVARAEYLELAAVPSYQETFMSALSFPREPVHR
ncbi:MAG TPA: ASKHA domain-containing protein [Vicinamibacterales bacterium]